MLQKRNTVLGLLTYGLLFCGQVSPAKLLTLTELGKIHKTDKDFYHGYTPIYDQYLTTFRKKAVNFLEIGFFNGASARMWDNYFVKTANLHFIDIDPATFNQMSTLSKRCTLDMVDQANAEALLSYVEKIGSDFDIIIDDGGHTMKQQIVTFKTLFPHLKSGGIFIIEDLHTSYWKQYGSEGTPDAPKASKDSTMELLKCLIDDVNYGAARSWRADHNVIDQAIRDTFNDYQKNIFSIHFYSGFCVIIKR